MVAKMAVILDFTKNSNLRENAIIAILFGKVVHWDRIKHFAALGSILCFFFYQKMGKNKLFLFKKA